MRESAAYCPPLHGSIQVHANAMVGKREMRQWRRCLHVAAYTSFSLPCFALLVARLADPCVGGVGSGHEVNVRIMAGDAGEVFAGTEAFAYLEADRGETNRGWLVHFRHV